MEARDSGGIVDLALRQAEAGASYIDVNAGMFHDREIEILTWLVETIQEKVKTPFAIDSPSAAALEAALKINKNGKPVINSITCEKERWDSVLPLVLEYNAGIIALCMDDNGMPETAEGRISIARTLIKKLTGEGVALGDIYIDPLIRPIGTGSHYGRVALDTIRAVKTEYPEAHIACGLSNISFGIPARKIVNQTFLIAAMAAGMDGAILDPLDKKLMTYLYASEALLGQDDFCMNYMEKFREGELEV
jgi:5-methyltetrahydrofolate--homocysteine methyltransferase